MENLKKMTKEESLNLLRLERLFIGDYINDDLNKLYDAVEQAINSEIVTYQEFTDDIVEYLSKIDDNDSTEDRSQFIKNMCNTLIEKYGRKEK